MPEFAKCPVCYIKESDGGRQKVTVREHARESHELFTLDVNCPRCGKFALTEVARQHCRSLTLEDRGGLSGFLRHASIRGEHWVLCWKPLPNAGYIAIDEAQRQRPGGIARLQDAFLVALSALAPTGKTYRAGDADSSLVYSVDDEVLAFHLHQLKGAGLLRDNPNPGTACLTTAGWLRIEDLERGTLATPRQGFVAMWFDSELETVYRDGFKSAIEGAGYDALQIGFLEHNDDISDRILAEIRRSRFLVADFTGGRGGVYFEAGFALGLGKPVIWTCRKDWMDRLHFDTNHRNHIDWETAEDLRERLRHRIEATIAI